ncbi:DinB family protein [Paenibacillus oenotherae]|uniref:DinB family protein n=1 Tax=Paenibacillus oenotherae TaxID=1435645 RepID=A0ABS7D444_9BACL|nr:DinB family protein [Paenibacillus oenotherae]MBW7474697.1 DinB family protein [Paenibacillus oenotherae]
MFRTVNDFTQEWEAEFAITARVLDTLTDESLGQTVADNYRSLGQIAWHLVKTIHFLTSTGLTFDEPPAEELPPASAARIASEYRRLGQALLRAVKSQWTDETIRQSVTIMGEEWQNSATVHYFLKHEIHHRGQMTVLMRQAGLPLPDVLGPTRESWIAKGIEPHA